MDNEDFEQLLSKYSETEDLVKKFEFNEEKTELHIIVDLIEHSVDLLFFTNCEGSSTFRYRNITEDETIEEEASSFHEFLENVLQKWCDDRDQLLGIDDDDDLDSDLDLTDSDDDEDALLDPNEDNFMISSEPVSPLFLAVKLAKFIFGAEHLTMVEGIFTLRFILPISPHTSKYYDTSDEGMLKCQFSREYMKNPTPPKIIPSKKSLFQTRLENISRKFVSNEWRNSGQPKSKLLVEFAELDSTRRLFIKKRTNLDTFFKTLLKDRKVLLKCYILFNNYMKVEDSIKEFKKYFPEEEEEGKDFETFFSKEEQDLLKEREPEILFILRFYVYLVLRIETIHEDIFCMLCDRKIRNSEFLDTLNQFGGSKEEKNDKKKRKQRRLKYPFVLCTSSTCQFFYFDQLIHKKVSHSPNICPSTISFDILENSTIVDLLITLCYASCVSERRSIIFRPFPPSFTKGVDECNHNALLSCMNKIPDVESMKYIISKNTKTLFLERKREMKRLGLINNINEEKEKDEDDEIHVKKLTRSRYYYDGFFEKSDELLKKRLGREQFELISWILGCNRGIMVNIPHQKKVSLMQTDYQYHVDHHNIIHRSDFFQSGIFRHKEEEEEHYDSPKRHLDEFETLKEKYGSFFGFHGSHLSNWHSIIRRGLQVGTGTKLQTTGSAYGKGIYLSPDAGTAIGYSGNGDFWKKSMFSESRSFNRGKKGMNRKDDVYQLPAETLRGRSGGRNRGRGFFGEESGSNNNNLQCVCICEIVKHPDIQTVPNPYWVIQNSDHLRIRFLFLYTRPPYLVLKIEDIESQLRELLIRK